MSSRQLWFGVWLVSVVAIVSPWGRFEDHVHWQRIALVPFLQGTVRPIDVILNVLLYLPCGLLLARGGGWSQALLAAFAVSAGTEISQAFSHVRFCSATDLACNVAGAAAGVALLRARPARAQASTPNAV